MTLELILGGAAAIAAVYAYALRQKIKKQRAEIKTLHGKIDAYENVIDDLEEVSNIIADDDERSRLYEKLRKRPT